MSETVESEIKRAKRSDTAELRRRYDQVSALLGDGYNHKQVCEHLRSEGLAIPYPQFRAIMSRLRKEKGQQKNAESHPAARVSISSDDSPSCSVYPEPEPKSPTCRASSDRKLSWNPGSQVKWK